jgi:hypothetical protein
VRPVLADLRESSDAADTLTTMAPQAGLWATTLGVSGFLCGFIGPMVLNPWANQGPMAGIFITGPGGALLGALLGALVAASGVQPASARRLRIGTATFGALAVLYTALPTPEYRATVLDLEVRGCVPARDWEARGVEIWERRLEVNANLWGAPPSGWRADFARESASGAVLTVDVRRHRDVVARRTYWNFGALDATPWSTARSRRMARPNHVYARGGCPGPADTAGTFVAVPAPEEERRPPTDPARFLDMLELTDVPDEWSGFAR